MLLSRICMEQRHHIVRRPKHLFHIHRLSEKEDAVYSPLESEDVEGGFAKNNPKIVYYTTDTDW